MVDGSEDSGGADSDETTILDACSGWVWLSPEAIVGDLKETLRLLRVFSSAVRSERFM